MYKTIVVGRGLIGTPAARYLAEASDGVILVGPDEPRDYQNHDGVFASHYDQGRITRIVDPDPEWAEAARQSIGGYRELERRSGIRFYFDVGHLSLGPKSSRYLKNTRQLVDGEAASTYALSASAIRSQFPCLDIDDDTAGLWEPQDGGYINPRSMIAAQQKLFEMAGGTTLRDWVTRISPTSAGVELETSAGSVIKAERALLATGAFTESTGIDLKSLALRVYARTVLLAQLDAELASALKDMPSIIQMPGDYYMLPPIPYPDRKTYAKIGQGLDTDPQLKSVRQMKQWFMGPGLESNRQQLPLAFCRLIPALKEASGWHSSNCVTTYTPSGLPYVDFLVADKIAVAIGGNGKAAKSGDHWGRLAADLILGRDGSTTIDRQKLKLPARSRDR